MDSFGNTQRESRTRWPGPFLGDLEFAPASEIRHRSAAETPVRQTNPGLIVAAGAGGRRRAQGCVNARLAEARELVLHA